MEGDIPLAGLAAGLIATIRNVCHRKPYADEMDSRPSDRKHLGNNSVIRNK